MFRILGRSVSIWLIAVICLLIAARLTGLIFSPPGFYVDEAATGAHVQAMLAHGTNAHGTPQPLFSSSLGGGYTTPTYLYPLIAWSAIFGTSELALRYFSQIATIAAVALLAWGVYYWTNKKTALTAAAAGLALPWGWLQGSLAWDPALVPLFAAIIFLCFTLLVFEKRRSRRLPAAIALPAFLVGLAYLYPPCRVTAPLLFLLAYGLLLYAKKISWKLAAASSVAAAVIATPLALFMFEPASLERSGAVSVFHGVPFFDGLISAVTNLLLLINPLFLFIAGDPNLRHSTGIQGMLGIGALLPLFALGYIGYKQLRDKKQIASTIQLLALFCLGAIVAALLGSALTGEGQPHSLRATAAWPFIVILIALGWRVLARRFSRPFLITAACIFAIGTTAYFVDLVSFYPARAADSFDVGAREQLKNGDDILYPPLSLKYYENR